MSPRGFLVLLWYDSRFYPEANALPVSRVPHCREQAGDRGVALLTLVMWLILLVLCWPLALAALVLYPIVWVLLLPFRLVGIALDGVLHLVWAVVTLPARILGWRR